jgi:hypothetical protein
MLLSFSVLSLAESFESLVVLRGRNVNAGPRGRRGVLAAAKGAGGPDGLRAAAKRLVVK